MKEKKNKILDINIQQDYISSLTTALPLCILLSDKNHMGWYYEHYIKIFSRLEYDILFECDLIDALNYSVGGYWDTRMIRFSYVPADIIKNVQNIHCIVKQYIEDMTYCVLFIDEFHIGAFNRKYHFAHEVLLYGYDDTEEIYYAVAFKEEKLDKFKISYDEMENGYKEVFNLGDRGGWSTRMFMQFRPVCHMTDYPFSLTDFIASLNEYLNSHYSEKEKYLSLFDEMEENISSNKIKEGISIELDFIEYLTRLRRDIKDKKENITLRYIAFHNLRDHKNLILNRLKYVNTIYSNKNIVSLITQYSEISKKSEVMRLLYIKIMVNLSIDNYTIAEKNVGRLINIINEIFVLERQILSLIILEYNDYISSNVESIN